MIPKLPSLIRSGLLAFGLIGSLSLPSAAAPAGLANSPVATGNASVLLVQGDGRYSECRTGGECYSDRNPGFSGSRPPVLGDRPAYRTPPAYRAPPVYRPPAYRAPSYDNRRNYRAQRDRYDRRIYRRDYRDRYRPGVYFGFGPSYYEPGYYDDYEPRYYEPRRVYRTMSRAHIRWCQNRYRSYRAYDNTFQPYNGPRRQCRSPYG